MGTAILRSLDCLPGNRFRPETLNMLPSTRRNPSPSPASNANNSSSRRRKRSPMWNQRNNQEKERNRPEDCASVLKIPAKNLVMGQVKILRRGEILNSSRPEKDRIVSVENQKPKFDGVENLDLALGSTDRLGPEPETVHNQIKVTDLKVADDLYAGSRTFYSSPPPSSLPLPAFLGKNDAATSDLIRMLRLDLA